MLVPEEYLVCTASENFKVHANYYRVDAAGTLFLYLVHGGELVFANGFWQVFKVGDGAHTDVTGLNKKV